MANKKISELESRASLSLSDLMAVGDPSTGYLYKTTISDLKTLTGAGVVSFNGRFGTVNPAEGDYTLTQLGDVIITSPSNGQVLKYNGSNWVNATEVSEADTLDTVTGRGNTTANSITVGSVTAAGLSNLVGQIRTFATTGNTYIGANPTSATDAGFKLDVLGTTRLNGNTTVTGVLTGSDTIRSTNGTVTASISYGSTAGIIGTTSNHSLELRTNNTYRVGVSTAGVVNIANLIGTGSRMVVADSAGNLSTQAIPDLSGYVTLDSFQTITASKTFSVGFSLASAGGSNQISSFANTNSIHSGSAGSNIFGFNSSNNIYFGKGLSNGGVIGWNNSAVRSYTLPNADGTLALTSDIPSLTNYVTLDGTQTITGLKTFSGLLTANGNIKATYYGFADSNGYSTGFESQSNNTIQVKIGSGLAINIASNNNTTFYGNIIRNGGTSSQFLKADGSLDSSTYLTSASVSGVYLPLSGGTLTGALNGTSAVFSGSGEFGNSVTIRSGNFLYINNAANTRSGILATTADGTELISHNGSGEPLLLKSPVGYISMFTNGSERARMTSGGLFGINTTNPTARLQISSTSAGAATVAAFLLNESTTTNTEVRLAFAANANNDVATNRYSYISALNTSGSNGQALIFATNETGNSAVERMRISSNGLVGIGNSIMSSFDGSANQLVVGTGTTNQGITIYASTSTESSLYFADGTGTASYRGYIFYNHAQDLMAIGTNGARAITILNSGNIGINTTTPGEKFEVNGSIKAVGRTVLGTQTGGLTMSYESGIGYIESWNSSPIVTAAYNYIAWYTSGSERMRITSGGDVLIGGSGGSHRLTVNVSGGADREMFIAGVSGVSNGFRVRYHNATGQVRVSMSSLPTSSSGLSSGDIWNDGGTLKIA